MFFSLTALGFATMVTAQVQPRVLVYSATAGYRHDSIPTAISELGQQQPNYNVSFTFTEDQGMFTDETLSGFDGVFFLLNSDEVLDANGQAALQKFFQSGGVYTGVHSASACLFNDTTYQQAVGALFDYHPELQSATFTRLVDDHPSTSNVPDRWTFQEEVYYFRSDPRSAGATVLLSVDESTYTKDNAGGNTTQGSPHPIAWYIESPESATPLLSGVSKAGRSFYTSLGHLNSTWQDPTFMGHVMGGLMWALEGGSTRAYGQGLVGATKGSGGSSPSPSGTSGAGASGLAKSGSATTSGGASTSAAAARTSGGAGMSKEVSGMAGAATFVLGALAAGLALIM